MGTPTIVKQTKGYLLIKVPLPRSGGVSPAASKNGKLTAAEQHLEKIIRAGEKEYSERKTIRALSTDQALKIYERKKDKIR